MSVQNKKEYTGIIGCDRACIWFWNVCWKKSKVLVVLTSRIQSAGSDCERRIYQHYQSVINIAMEYPWKWKFEKEHLYNNWLYMGTLRSPCLISRGELFAMFFRVYEPEDKTNHGTWSCWNIAWSWIWFGHFCNASPSKTIMESCMKMPL